MEIKKEIIVGSNKCNRKPMEIRKEIIVANKKCNRKRTETKKETIVGNKKFYRKRWFMLGSILFMVVCLCWLVTLVMLKGTISEMKSFMKTQSITNEKLEGTISQISEMKSRMETMSSTNEMLKGTISEMKSWMNQQGIANEMFTISEISEIKSWMDKLSSSKERNLGSATPTQSILKDRFCSAEEKEGPQTIGDSILAMKALLPKLGSTLITNDSELSSLPALIEFVIRNSPRDEVSSSKDLSRKAQVIPGNVIAFGRWANTCITIKSGLVSYVEWLSVHDPRNSEVPNGHSSRFVVVDAGNGKVAFYNPTYQRFLALEDGKLVTGGLVTSVSDRPRGVESFEEEDAGIILEANAYYARRLPGFL